MAKANATKKPTHTSSAAAVKDAKAEAKLARAEAIKARAEAAKAKAMALQSTPIGGFVDFIREKGVVGLAVGLAIGTAATVLVTQMVAAVVTPMVGLLVGKNGLDGLNTTITIGNRSEVFAFGDLIDALIKFLAVAAVVYFVVIGLGLDKLDKKKDK